MEHKENKPRAMGLNIGSASIIMLFAVLCLTVLAALSLLSANSQYALAQRSANVSKAYYEADFKAMEIYERAKNGEDVEYDYTVEIDEHQMLDVSLGYKDDELVILRWNIIDSGAWEPDDIFDFWDGQ